MATVSDLTTTRYSGDFRVDALLQEPPAWNFLLPYRSVLYYTFDAASGSPIDLVSPEVLTPFNAAQRAAAATLLAHVSAVTGIDFVPVASGAGADLHFAAADLDGASSISGLSRSTAGYSYTDGELLTSVTGEAYVYLDNLEFGYANDAPTAGGAGYETLLHEIGHAMGLGHPFEPPYPLSAAQDNTDNTVMSYTHAGAYKSEFQAYDLLALTWIYGGDGLGGTWGYNSTMGPSLDPVIDTTAPVVVGWAPADGATGVALSANIVVTFSEDVARGTGGIVLRTAAGAAVETFDAVTSARLAIDGAVLTVDPSVTLAYGTGYRIEFAAGTLVDLAGNPYAGTTTYDFTTLTQPNRAPVAANAAVATNEDTPLSSTLPAASDADGDTVSYTKAGNPAHGTLAIAGGGGYVYTPAADYHGADAFSYTVSDGRGGTNTYTVSVTVAAVNDAPVLVNALADQFAIQGAAFSWQIPAGAFADPDGDALAFSARRADGGALPAWLAFDAAQRSFSGTPGNADVGEVLVRVTAADPSGATRTNTLRVSVANADDEANATLTVAGAAREGGSLSAALDGLVDADGTPTVAWRWQSSVDGASGWVDLGGALASTFAIADDQSLVGRSLRVIATTTDPLGGSTVFASTPLRVENLNDAPAGAVTIEGTPLQGQTLAASQTLSDADGLGPVGWQWQADGIDLAGATEATLTLTAAEVGRAIRVLAGYVDGQGTREVVASLAAGVVAGLDTAPPVLVEVSPAEGASGVDTAVDLLLGFSEPVQRGGGEIVLERAGGAAVAIYDPGGDPRLAIDGSALMLATGDALEPGERYVLRLAPGSVVDLAGNEFAGLPGHAFSTLPWHVVAGTPLPDQLFGEDGRDAITGLDGDDHLVGGAGGDRIDGGEGWDTIIGGAGDDRIDGGGGLDTAAYAGAMAEYAVVRDPHGAVGIDGPEGIDTLAGVERAAFADLAVGFDLDGLGGSAYRLYQAAFDRVPDAAGVGFWIHYLDRGFGLVEAAAQFVASAEFTALYGSAPTNAEFTRLLYLNVLDREPDADGYGFWNAALTGGSWQGESFGRAFARAEVLLFFSESAENEANVAALIGNGFVYQDWAG